MQESIGYFFYFQPLGNRRLSISLPAHAAGNLHRRHQEILGLRHNGIGPYLLIRAEFRFLIASGQGKRGGEHNGQGQE